MFFVIEKSNICNFADDNTLYSCGANLKTVLENLTHDASKLLYWFKINSMKANPEKFQFMILSKKLYQPQKLSVNTFTIGESDEVELQVWPLIRRYILVSTLIVFQVYVLLSFFTHKEILYNLRKCQVFSLPPARSTYYRTNPVHFWGSLIWNKLPLVT